MMPHAQISACIWQIVLLSAIWTVVTSASAHQPNGFISIDCGNAIPYQDSLTNLTWMPDEEYIQTGQNGIVAVRPYDSDDNSKALLTFRYFVEPRSKYCYELPLTTGNISILIRAMFYQGNASELDYPITFNVYIGATLWTSVKYDHSDEWIVGGIFGPKVIEGIFYSQENITFFCLVPDQGVPFISALELRQLDHEGLMYNFTNRQNLLLSTLFRSNLGSYAPIDPYPSSQTVRYPDDAYDRFWTPVTLKSFAQIPNTSISSRRENANTSSEWNNVPPRVMMDAYSTSTFLPSIDLTSYLPLSTCPSYMYAIFYCQALNSTEALNMVISLNEEETTPFSVTNIRPIVKSFAHSLLKTYDLQIHVYDSSPSDFGAIVNAMEIYEEILFDPYATTFTADANIVNFLKKTFNLSSWQGDPCFPIPYNWITCYTTVDRMTFMGSLHLSNLTDSARLQTLKEEGHILLSLDNLSITHSHVDDATSQSLIETFNMRILNLSYNSLSSLPNFTLSLGILYIVDVSYNSILSDISDSYSFMAGFESSYLQELNLSDNSLQGTFPSDLYFSDSLTSLKLLNLDRNSITGLLNLSTWYQELQRVIAYPNSDNYMLHRVYSLVANNISDIIPSADDIHFTRTVEFLMKNNSYFNQSGVLLAGNPYCKDAQSVTQRFLCRSTINDIVDIYGKPKKGNKVIVIVFSTLGGVFFIFVGSIIFIIIWRLWQQLSITTQLLQEVQQELTSREVQPRYYSYHDLKVATRSFHQDNRLGSGAFADVYKGFLSDGSIVAVKRLFNYNKKQVLNEFLSEVILISEIKHKNLIQLKGCCLKDEERILIYEIAKNGNLAEALWGQHKDKILDWTHRLNVAVGVARGLSYLHEELQPRIIHRDIKAVNVLLDENLNAKIADFGLAKPFREEETHAQFTTIAGTRGYSAPEYVMEGQLTVKADVFSFGILLLEIMSGRKCIDSTLPPDRVYIKNWAEDLQKSGTLLELLQLELQNFVPESEFIMIMKIALSCVETNPKFRPTMSQVVTMLLGSLEVENFWKEHGNNHGQARFPFDSLEEDKSIEEGTSMSSGIKYDPIGFIYEDFEEVPYICKA